MRHIFFLLTVSVCAYPYLVFASVFFNFTIFSQWCEGYVHCEKGAGVGNGHQPGRQKNGGRLRNGNEPVMPSTADRIRSVGDRTDQRFVTFHGSWSPGPGCLSSHSDSQVGNTGQAWEQALLVASWTPKMGRGGGGGAGSEPLWKTIDPSKGGGQWTPGVKRWHGRTRRDLRGVGSKTKCQYTIPTGYCSTYRILALVFNAFRNSHSPDDKQRSVLWLPWIFVWEDGPFSNTRSPLGPRKTRRRDDTELKTDPDPHSTPESDPPSPQPSTITSRMGRKRKQFSQETTTTNIGVNGRGVETHQQSSGKNISASIF